GELDKGRTRMLAAELGLPVANKPDSQEVCFVPDNDYPAFLARLMPESRREGEIVDPAGQVLGHHQGVAGFTVGQRKGLGVSSLVPLYVTSIRRVRTRLPAPSAHHRSLFAREAPAVDTNLISLKEPGGSCSVTAKIRYNMPDQPAVMRVEPDERFHVCFDEPQ